MFIPTSAAPRHRRESEITVIDAARAVVVDRMALHSVAGVFHLAFSADGRLGAAAEYHPKNLVPLAHLEHGGAFADTLTVFGADVGKTGGGAAGRTGALCARPFGVAIAPDKSRIYVTSGGSEMVTVIDVPRLLRLSSIAHPEPASRRICRRARNYVVARIPVGTNPRGLTLSRDGRRLYVANRLDDTISVIDTRTNRVASDDQAGRAEENFRRCAMASRHFIPRAIVSRGRSAAPVAISIRPSTALPGTWSRMALGATSWTTR